MQLTDADIGDGDAAGTALVLLRAIGPQALPLAEEQMARCADRADLVEQWTVISTAMRALLQANAHLDLALQLLDLADTAVATAKVDGALVELGFRSPQETSHLLGQGDQSAVQTHYRRCAEHHISCVDDIDDHILKERHLAIASRYLQLAEVV